MKQIKISALSLCLFLISFKGLAQQGKVFFVSPSGNDKWKGSIHKPFGSLEKARNAVRKLLQQDRNASITVYLRSGTYYFSNSVVFDSLDSGSEHNPVNYSAYNQETVSLNGGVSIPTKYATPVKDNAILERFPATAKDK